MMKTITVITLILVIIFYYSVCVHLSHPLNVYDFPVNKHRNIIKKFCINLDKNSQRFERIKTQLPGIIRYPGVHGKNIPKDDLEKMVPKKTFDILMKVSHVRTAHDTIETYGAVGCALSHINLWKKLVDDPIATEYLICEDDLYLTGNLEFPPNDYDIAFYGTGIPTPASILTKKWAQMTKIYGLHCYLITKKAAEVLLYKAFPLEYQIDSYISLYSNKLKMYKYTNEVAHQGYHDSDVQTSCNDCGEMNEQYTDGSIATYPIFFGF